MKVMQKLRRGATFIEYAMLAGLVAIVVAVGAMMFGEQIKGLFKSTGDQTKNVNEAVIKADITPNVTLDEKK